MSRSGPRSVLALVAVLASCGGGPHDIEPAADGTVRPTDVVPATIVAPSSPAPPTTRTVATAPTTVPDAFAARAPYPSCGEDHSLDLDSVGPPSRARRCLLDANTSGKPAELTSYETGTAPDAPRFYVYRTNPDRTVDVFVPNVGRSTERPWQLFRCQALGADERRVFELVGCGAPVDIE